MIRNDFVSNSSSSSYIVSISNDYKIDNFCNDIADKTISKNYEYDLKYRDPNLRKRNFRILSFCIDTYALLFLGTWIVKENELILSKEELGKYYGFEDKESIESEWKHELKLIEECKKPDCSPYIKKDFGKNYVDKDGKLHAFYNTELRDVVMDISMMQCMFNRFNNSDDDIQDRIAIFKKLSEVEDLYAFHHRPNTYQITLDTLNNTKDLIKSGINLDLGSINIDDLEKRLKSGDKIIAFDINYQGGGYDPYCIYSEDRTLSFANIPMDILYCENE